MLTKATPVQTDGSKIVMGLSLSVDITELKLAEQRERDFEEHKLEFYRRLILAATDGKLCVVDREEIERSAGAPLLSWEIKTAKEMEAMRNSVADAAVTAGMAKDKIEAFVVCIGEAVTNAIKHAGGGLASLHHADEGLIFKVVDRGPGIEALSLPDVALRSRYSTSGTLGIGYKVMLAFCNEVSLATSDEGTTVAMKMNLHKEEEPSFAAELLNIREPIVNQER